MDKALGTFFAMVLALALLSVFANAAVVKWSAPVGIVVQSTSVNVYWDSSWTKPVTTIDFGTVTKGLQTLYKYMYIKNLGTAPVKVYWNSSLGSITGKISNLWFTNGSQISAGSYLYDDYSITLSQDIPIGTYNWTLNLWTD
jgi:hypothetical protein